MIPYPVHSGMLHKSSSPDCFPAYAAACLRSLPHWQGRLPLREGPLPGPAVRLLGGLPAHIHAFPCCLPCISCCQRHRDILHGVLPACLQRRCMRAVQGHDLTKVALGSDGKTGQWSAPACCAVCQSALHLLSSHANPSLQRMRTWRNMHLCAHARRHTLHADKLASGCSLYGQEELQDLCGLYCGDQRQGSGHLHPEVEGGGRRRKVPPQVNLHLRTAVMLRMHVQQSRFSSVSLRRRSSSVL